MTTLPLDQLPVLSKGFLLPVQLQSMGAGVLVQGGYDLTRFSPDLFEQLGITRPESLSRAIDKRLAEFLAGRCMAQAAQTALGLQPRQVEIGPDRAPIWPKGVTGSISHARGRCACYALPTGIGDPGIDVELIATGHALESIQRLTMNAEEQLLLSQADNPEIAATLCFSAKETLFKALYPTVQRHFGFASAMIDTAPTNGILTLELTEELHSSLPAMRRFDLNYTVANDHVLTWLLHKDPLS